MNKIKIVLIGAGGAGKELAMNLETDPRYEVLGFVDDTKSINENINGLPVFGGIDWLEDYEGNVAICIVNNPQIKRDIVARLAYNPKLEYPVIKNNFSIYSRFIEYGTGVIIAQPYNYITVNIKIGDFVWINTRSDIGHGVEIGDYTTIFTRVNIGGDVKIGSDCVIGSGVTIKPAVTIGNNVTIGAGAVVVKDVPNDVIIVGNPARVLQHKIEDNHWYNK